MLELGCGTGRVALHLARRGHEVIGLDSDPELLAVLAERGAGQPLSTVEADARDFLLERPASLILAPTHLLQLLADASERAEALRCIAAALRPGACSPRRSSRTCPSPTAPLLRSPTCARSTAGSTRAWRSRPRSDRVRSSSGGCAIGSRPTVR